MMCGMQEAVLEANNERDANLQQHEARQAENLQAIEALQDQAWISAVLLLSLSLSPPFPPPPPPPPPPSPSLSPSLPPWRTLICMLLQMCKSPCLGCFLCTVNGAKKQQPIISSTYAMQALESAKPFIGAGPAHPAQLPDTKLDLIRAGLI